MLALLQHPAILTCLAMAAFAANSVFSRLGLEAGEMDAAAFATIRMVSGAGLLLILVWMRSPSKLVHLKHITFKDMQMAACLFGYMALFTFAYLTLATGVGALILFGSVQLTMFAIALRGGERFVPLAWVGIGVAVLGLALLLVPTALLAAVDGIDLLGGVMMIGAGVSWGLYSVLGRGTQDPLLSTTRNFVLGFPLVLFLSAAFLEWGALTLSGVFWAVASGALASGCGYAIWYAALPRLTTGIAAVVQLTVPVLAAVAGVLFLQEALTLQMLTALILTLGGVLLVIKTAQS